MKAASPVLCEQTEAKPSSPTALCPTCRLPLDPEARAFQDMRNRHEHTRWQCEACKLPAWGWDWDDGAGIVWPEPEVTRKPARRGTTRERPEFSIEEHDADPLR